MGVDIFHFEKTLWLPRGEMANWEASGQADRGQLAWARHWGDGTFGEMALSGRTEGVGNGLVWRWRGRALRGEQGRPLMVWPHRPQRAALPHPIV